MFRLQLQELHTKCPDLLEEPLGDAALDVSHHVPQDNAQPSGCTLMLRASPGLSSAALPASPLLPVSIALAAAQAPLFLWEHGNGDNRVFLESKSPYHRSGQCYGKETRKAFRQAVIQVSLGCSLVERPKQSVLVSQEAQNSGCLCQVNRPGGRGKEPAAIVRCLYPSIFLKTKYHAVPPDNFQPICMKVLMFCFLCWWAACFRAIFQLFLPHVCMAEGGTAHSSTLLHCTQQHASPELARNELAQCWRHLAP